MQIKIENSSSVSGVVMFLFFLIWWIAGVVLAVGFWMKTLGVFFFPYALYLVVEKVMYMNGWFAPVCQ